MQSYDVEITGDDESVLLRKQSTSETRATIAKAQMTPGVIYTISVRATMRANGETIERSRTAQIRYQEPTDFTYAVLEGGETIAITGYTGVSPSLTVPSKLEGKRVTRIATGAFNGVNCAVVTSVAWPEGVTFEVNSVAGLTGCADENGFLVFDGVLCEYFGTAASAEIPEGVIRINDGAFEGKASLKSVKIPDTVETIGARAFADCEKLKTMTTY